MKRRTIAIMLAAMLAITTAACGNAADYVDNAVPETTVEASVETTMEETVEDTAPASVEETTEESVEESVDVETGNEEPADAETTEVAAAEAPTEVAAETAAEPTAAPVAVAAKVDTTVTAAEPEEELEVVGAVAIGAGDRALDSWMETGNYGQSQTQQTAPAPVTETVSAQPAAPAEPVSTPAPTAPPIATPAPTEAPAHVHDYSQPVYTKVFRETEMEYVEWQEEQEVLVHGVECLVCGLFREGAGTLGDTHCLTCCVRDENTGEVILAGSRGVDKYVTKTVTIGENRIKTPAHYEDVQTGWKCSCGATKGMDE